MDYNKKILQFFTDELSSEERLEVKAEMATNYELSEDMKLQQEVLFTIANDNEHDQDFRQQLQNIGDEFLADQQKPRVINMNYWLAAASVIVVLGLGTYFGLLNDTPYGSEQAFLEYYAPYGTNLTVRGENQSGAFVNAISDYQNGNISTAIEAFDGLKTKNEEMAGFFLGLCYIESGDIEAAKSEFLNIQKNAVFYAEHIDWYLALCYLKQGENDKAELQLTRITTSGNSYADKANDLLAKLKN